MDAIRDAERGGGTGMELTDPNLDYEPVPPECAHCGREGHDVDRCPNLDKEPYVPIGSDEPW